MLPEFHEPPVVEVAVSIQFRPLELLRTAQLGVLWSEFRSEGYSRLEEHSELEPAFESFDGNPPAKVGIKFQAYDDAPPPPRVWFLNEKLNELIQVQRDRLIVNWRKGASPDPYPRYVRIIERFRSALDSFSRFAHSEKLGDVVPTQCELTYVNHLPAGLGWNEHGELGNVVTTWQNRYSDEYLGTPEDVAFQARYRMIDSVGSPIGRLHVTLTPARTSSGLQPILVVNLTARGRPEPTDFAAAFDLFDREHEWIVRGFTSITTERMHEVWRRKDG